MSQNEQIMGTWDSPDLYFGQRLAASYIAVMARFGIDAAWLN